MLEKLLMKIRIWTWTESQNLTTRVSMKQLLPVYFFPLLQEPPKSVKNLEHSHNLHMVGREEFFFQAWRTRSTHYHVKLCFLAAACLTQPFAPNLFTHLLPWFWGFGFLQLLAWNANAIQRMLWSEPHFTWNGKSARMAIAWFPCLCLKSDRITIKLRCKCTQHCFHGKTCNYNNVPHLQHFHNNDKMCLRCSLPPLSCQRNGLSHTSAKKRKCLPDLDNSSIDSSAPKSDTRSPSQFFEFSLHPFPDKSPLDFLKAFSTSCKVQNSLSVNKQSFQQIPKTIFTADSWKQSFTVDFWNNLLQQISENSRITFISWTFFSLISYELIGLPKLLL